MFQMKLLPKVVHHLTFAFEIVSKENRLKNRKIKKLQAKRPKKEEVEFLLHILSKKVLYRNDELKKYSFLHFSLGF